MDIHSKALHIFKGFIDDLIKVFPEYKVPLFENYSDILALETLRINDNQKIKEFLNKIDSLSTEITDKNECIFDNDLFLLKDVCFHTCPSPSRGIKFFTNVSACVDFSPPLAATSSLLITIVRKTTLLLSNSAKCAIYYIS